MDLPEFKRRLRNRYGINTCLGYILCVAVILLGFLPFVNMPKPFSRATIEYSLILITITTTIGVYGVNAVRNKNRPLLWANLLSKEKNKQLLGLTLKQHGATPLIADPDHQQFIYKRKWWQPVYAVHLFAGDQLVAVKVDGTRAGMNGIIEFGASRRLERKFINSMKELAEKNFRDLQ